MGEEPRGGVARAVGTTPSIEVGGISGNEMGSESTREDSTSEARAWASARAASKARIFLACSSTVSMAEATMTLTVSLGWRPRTEPSVLNNSFIWARSFLERSRCCSVPPDLRFFFFPPSPSLVGVSLLLPIAPLCSGDGDSDDGDDETRSSPGMGDS